MLAVPARPVLALALLLVSAVLMACQPPTASQGQPSSRASTSPQPAAGTPVVGGTPLTSASVASGPLKTFQIVPEESQASYDVQEQFLNQPLPSRAVGKTTTISGEFQLALG